MKTFIIYVLAAAAEIAGCFAFWAWLKLHKPAFWVLPGLISLAIFAFLLTRVDAPAAGRVYAAYGAIYIASSIAWLWAVEHQKPDNWDLVGTTVCLVGAAIILFGPRTA
jgi:small multidrug resistance family-3 protein